MCGIYGCIGRANIHVLRLDSCQSGARGGFARILHPQGMVKYAGDPIRVLPKCGDFWKPLAARRGLWRDTPARQPEAR